MPTITRAYINEPGHYVACYGGSDAAARAVAYVLNRDWPDAPRGWTVQVHVHFSDGSMGNIWHIRRPDGTRAWSSIHPTLKQYLPA